MAALSSQCHYCWCSWSGSGTSSSCSLTQRIETKAHTDCKEAIEEALFKTKLQRRLKHTSEELWALMSKEVPWTQVSLRACLQGSKRRRNLVPTGHSENGSLFWLTDYVITIFKLCMSLLRICLVYLYTHSFCIGTRLQLGDLLEILKRKSLTSVSGSHLKTQHWVNRGSHACLNHTESSKLAWAI